MSKKTYRCIVSRLYLTLGAFVLASGLAHANPENGQVVAGSATIESNAKTLNVYQSSQKAVINWGSFNIAPDEHTQFHQPNSSSFTLNRVLDTNASRIEGMVSANGNIAIINPNGVYFDQGSKVDVGGLVVTTSDITDQDFMNGNGNFSISGKANAQIINNGTITAKDAGLVGLVAPHVENNGVIQARLGKVALASGDTFYYDFGGDGLINVAVSEENANRQQIVKNAGHIQANGGEVLITAGAARDVVNSLVTNTGVVEAKSIGMKNGKIVLSGSGSNKTQKTGNAVVLNQGTLDVSGTNDGEMGGTIHILGDHVGAMENSIITASGSAGGGEILIGGNYQGSDDTQTSKITYIDTTAIVDASASDNGDGGRIIAWADDVNRTYGTLKSDAGDNGGDGGFIEISGKDHLDFQGTVSLKAPNGEDGTVLFDPTDIEISTAANLNVSAATPFQPNLNNGPSILNTTTLLNAIAAGNVTVQTIAGGTQEGNITVSNALSWSANRTVNFIAHNKIIVNAPITARGVLNFTAADIDLNANMIEHVSGATLALIPRANNITVGIAGGAGSFNLTNADLNFIQNGWNTLTIGATGSTALMDVGARTWNVPTVLRTSTGELRISGAQNAGANAFSLQTRNINILSTLTGTGTLNLTPNANVTVGIAGGAGTFNLTTAELNNIVDGWRNIVIGRSTNTQAMNVSAHTWNDPLTLVSQTGAININATPIMGANNLLLQGRTFNLNADLIGTGTLTLQPDTNITVGVAGGAGTLNLSNALLDRIIDGWTGINIGRTNSTSAMNVNQRTWNDSVSFRTGTGAISINGTQNVGSNNLGIFTNGNPVINAALTGTRTLRFEQIATTTTMGIAGGAGTYNLTTAELNQITDGWNLITFGLASNDAVMNVNAHTWNDSVRFQNDTAVITIAGEQNVGANNLTIRSDSNPAINAALTGTGTLTFQTDATNTTIGVAGGAGTYNLSTAELNRITDGWQEIIIGRTDSTAAMAVNAHTWNDNLRLQSNTGVITVAGAQNLGTNNLRIITSANLALNNNLIGTGNLGIETTATNTTIGLAGGAGTLNLTTAELNRIVDGWNSIRIGKSTGTGAMAVNAYTWNDDLILESSTGVITIAGAQNLGSNDLTFKTSGNLALNADLIGTGNLGIETTATNTTIGLAGGAGTLNLTTAELNRIVDGWNSIRIGKSTGTGAMAVNAYTWNDNLTLQSNTGAITIAGAQNLGTNDLTLNTASLAINAAVTGTGDLRITPIAANTTVGLAGGAGTLNLTTAELNNIANGWDNIIIGRTDGTATITANAHTWNDDVTIQSDTGVITIAGDQNFGSNDLSIQTDSNLALNANLIGTGHLSIAPNNDATTMGLAGGAGTLNLTAIELGRLNNGWGSIAFGKTGATAATTLGGDMTLTNSDIIFNNRTVLSANSILNNGNGDVTFADTLNGGFNLTINNTGDVTFNDDVGVTTRLGALTLNSAQDVTSTTDLRVSSLNITNATGAATFNGAGLNSTGNVSIESNGISGILSGTNGVLDSGTGTINSEVNFTTLDIDGTGATLTAGYVGTPGVATQEMANLITRNGAFFTPSSALFMFDTFEIGYAPITNPILNLTTTALENLINVSRQSSDVAPASQSNSDDTFTPLTYIIDQDGYDFVNNTIVIHPELLRSDANPPSNKTQETAETL